MPNLSQADRFTGCLLAGALGDAIGSYFEGKPADSHFEIPPSLRITDDTQLTIATCESIIEMRSVQPESVAQNFLRWYRQRRITGIGASTLKSFTELEVGGHWALVGATGERSAGNGAAMRIAPLAFVLDPDDDTERGIIRDICRITHHNDEAYIGALSLIRTIRHVINGNPLNHGILDVLVDSLPDSRVRDRLIIVRDSSYSIAEYVSRFASSGYVVDSVPLAILAVIQSSDALSTIQLIVKSGGDTDTVASMFGHIYGAAFGSEVLPAEIVNQIDDFTLVRETAGDFVEYLSER